MHGDYVDRTIVKYTKRHYLYTDTYDEHYDSNIDHFVHHSANLHDHAHSIIPELTIQISEPDVKPKDFVLCLVCYLVTYLSRNF